MYVTPLLLFIELYMELTSRVFQYQKIKIQWYADKDKKLNVTTVVVFFIISFFSLFILYKAMFMINKSILKRNTYMTKSRCQNEYDRIMTTMSFNNWTWPKLKPTNLKITSGVLLAWCFFSCRRAMRGWAGVPASMSLRAGAGGPVQADRTSIFFGVKVNVCHCIFWSCSIVKVRRCETLLVMF